jgi:hypothetical protein
MFHVEHPGYDLRHLMEEEVHPNVVTYYVRRGQIVTLLPIERKSFCAALGTLHKSYLGLH